MTRQSPPSSPRFFQLTQDKDEALNKDGTLNEDDAMDEDEFHDKGETRKADETGHRTVAD